MPEKRQNIHIDCLRNVDGKTYPALRTNSRTFLVTTGRRSRNKRLPINPGSSLVATHREESHGPRKYRISVIAYKSSDVPLV
nr:unnamed protein product [Callosobruchus chinensis]